MPEVSLGTSAPSTSHQRAIQACCDGSHWTTEADPLKSIDAEHVAKEIIKVFTRVGVPEKILTDQVSQFMSKLLMELYRLLHIHSIRTSPYHPQIDGLVVECFNQTLKSMLQKAVAGEGNKLIPYLLFACREVPQASTRFSPFKLLYGRNVRGPLYVLHETWKQSEDSVVSYVLATQEKLRDTAEIVKENLTRATKETEDLV